MHTFLQWQNIQACFYNSSQLGCWPNISCLASDYVSRNYALNALMHGNYTFFSMFEVIVSSSTSGISGCIYTRLVLLWMITFPYLLMLASSGAVFFCIVIDSHTLFWNRLLFGSQKHFFHEEYNEWTLPWCFYFYITVSTGENLTFRHLENIKQGWTNLGRGPIIFSLKSCLLGFFFLCVFVSQGSVTLSLFFFLVPACRA